MQELLGNKPSGHLKGKQTTIKSQACWKVPVAFLVQPLLHSFFKRISLETDNLQPDEDLCPMPISLAKTLPGTIDPDSQKCHGHCQEI
jgi:hypothetical protein